MILKLLWIKWNIQKTNFWCYFWINIIFKIIFVSLFSVPPCPMQKNLIPPKKFLPFLWKFSIPPLNFQNFFLILNLGWERHCASIFDNFHRGRVSHKFSWSAGFFLNWPSWGAWWNPWKLEGLAKLVEDF